MSFGFRKSFSSAPFRFTLSPRGLSSSFGVRGARISSGPRGTFVTVSSHGAYYRQRIGNKRPPVAPNDTREPEDHYAAVDSAFRVPISELIASNQSELVTSLNRNVSALNPAFICFGAISCFGLTLIPLSPTIAVMLLLGGLLLGIMLSKRFKETHTQEIHYSLDPQSTDRYDAIRKGLSALSSCSRVWALNAQWSTSDLKHNAGARTLMTRKPASVGRLPTKGFKTSLSISSIEANGTAFHFLPDQVLLCSRNCYASIPYADLSVDVVATRFVESEAIPQDSRQLDTTWRYVNINGGPDRRFNNNHQIPILQYGQVTLRTGTGLEVILQTSNLEKAQTFASQIRASLSAKGPEQRSTEDQAKDAVTVPLSLLSSYALLGLSRPTTVKEASAAHRQRASLYHPDKYEHLAPEMKVLAAAKMAEINAAYLQVKMDLQS